MKLKKLSIALLAVVICIMACACSGTDEETAESIQIGTFAAEDLEGNEVTDAIFADKDVTVLNVWATFCGPCKDEMPDIQAMAEELPDNAQVVGVVIDAPQGDEKMTALAAEICESAGVKYTNITASESVAGIFGSVAAVPTTFIVDSEGKLVCPPIVGADVDGYRDAVSRYLGE